MNTAPASSLAIGSALAFAFAGTSAQAADERSCLDRAFSNYEFAQCTASIVQASDQKLNAAWNRLFRFAGGSRSAKGRALLREQRAWLAFRAKACAGYSTPESGREDQVIHGPLCVAETIDARTAELNDRYHQTNH